jgi:hypothetical protein
MKSPMQAVRDLRKPRGERQQAKQQRRNEKQAHEAERLAARTAGEARRYSNQAPPR